MKKTKLLTTIVGLTGLTIGLTPTITVCSCNKSDVTPTPTPTVNIGKFNGVKWTAVIKAISTFEAETSPQASHAIALCKALNVETPTYEQSDDAKTILEKNIVGKTGTLLINNKLHNIVCIGAMHDKDTNDKIVALTFELSTLLSGTDGNMLSSRRVRTQIGNYDYTNSELRYNLNGTHSGSTLPERVWEKTALSMLPSKIQSAIKNVKKSIAISKDSGATYSVNTYEDKLFPLTYTEMAQSGSESALVEGSPYYFWTNHKTSEDRIKKDVNGNEPWYYWLSSPNIKETTKAWAVSLIFSSVVPSVDVGFEKTLQCGLSFAFCI